MSKYNYSYEDASGRSRAKLELWDMLSILMLLMTFCLVAYFVAVFLFPNSALNPFPPSQVDPFAPPTPTITPIQLEPTWTVTPPSLVTDTPTLLPTFTLEPSPTFFSLVPPTDTPSPTIAPKMPISAGIPQPIPSTVMHPEYSCNWQGVGGTVVDTNNAPMLYSIIRLVGTYNGKSVTQITASGIAPGYGQGGYEFELLKFAPDAKPISSKNELYLQIFDQGGFPMSDRVYINLSNDCSKNLVIVRFKKNP